MHDPHAIAHELLAHAAAGAPELSALRGYALGRELGRGGMGVVYLIQRPGGERLALKLMLPEPPPTGASRALFVREMINTRALSHPNVVRLAAAGEHAGTLFVALEFCDGGSIADLLKTRGGRLDVATALRLIGQVLDGLQYAHDASVPVTLADGTTTVGKGLVHRDVKPQNMLLGGGAREPIAKLSDYGLAKAFALAGLSGHTVTDSVGGTPVFMPRQQVINYKYAGPEVDVWAAAASLYCMLTGAYPRDFSRQRTPVETIVQTDAVPIRQRESSIPPALARAIDHALIDRPDILVRTAAGLKRMLDAAAR